MEDNTILFVDNDEELQNAIGIYLSRLGYDVIKVQSASAALTSIEETMPACTIVGSNITDMTCGNFVKKVKTEYADVELVVMVDAHEKSLGIECLKLNATDYIIKPIIGQELEVLLQRAYEKKDIKRKFKQYEQRLDLADKNTALFQQLFDEVPCYISLQDRNFRLTGSNKRFKNDFGDHIGPCCYEIYKHRSEPCRECPVESTFKDGKPHQTEEVVTSQYGQQYNVLTWTAPIRDISGEITQVMEMSTNITQIRKLQSHLTSLGLLLGSMSHGVRGLLTALDGGIYRLEKGIEKGDERRTLEALEVVKKMAVRIRGMILDILYYTKKRDLKWRPVDINNFAAQLADQIRERAEKHGIELICDFKQAAGVLEIDPETVSSAMINILDNSIDACLDDKSSDKAHKVEFSVKDQGEQFIFEVTDNGYGMDRHTKENLFTLFFSSKGHRGTGLGLFIANQIIEQHGGRVDVESTLGDGSCFKVSLNKILPDTAKNNASENRMASNGD